MRVTINNINKTLLEKGFEVEIVKGEDYFYFIGLPNSPLGCEDGIESICSNVLSCMTIDEYVEYVKEGYNKCV